MSVRIHLLKSRRRVVLLVVAAVLGLWALGPESPVMPVVGADGRDWNRQSFWFEPWGRSGVHKGIDIFAPRGTPVVSPTYGVVVFRGDIEMGGHVVALIGPKFRLHYLAHLQDSSVRIGSILRTGSTIGRVGDTGNARGKPPHLHLSVVTLIPYPWRADRTTQGWKKAFYLNPADVLDLY